VDASRTRYLVDIGFGDLEHVADPSGQHNLVTASANP
jgi:hypothetical protein